MSIHAWSVVLHLLSSLVGLDIIKFTALPDSSYTVVVINLFLRCRSNAILISIKYKYWLWGICSIGEAHRFWVPHLWPSLVILWLNWVELQLTVMGVNIWPGDLCREVEAPEWFSLLHACHAFNSLATFMHYH